jgi:hypothetical protein
VKRVVKNLCMVNVRNPCPVIPTCCCHHCVRLTLLACCHGLHVSTSKLWVVWCVVLTCWLLLCALARRAAHVVLDDVIVDRVARYF